MMASIITAPLISESYEGKRFDPGDYIEFNITENSGISKFLTMELSSTSDFTNIVYSINGLEILKNDVWEKISFTNDDNVPYIHRMQLPIHDDGIEMIETTSSGTEVDVTDDFIMVDTETSEEYPDPYFSIVVSGYELSIAEQYIGLGKYYVRIKAVNVSDETDITYSNTVMIRIGKHLVVQTVPFEMDTLRTVVMLYDDKSVDQHAILKIYASNNAFDLNPVWEDITDNYNNRKFYYFKNRAQISSKSGISFRYEIDATEDSVDDISLKGYTFAAC